MESMINPGAGPTRVKLVIARSGIVCNVVEESDETNSDPLNNTAGSDKTWTVKGSTLAYRYYPTRWHENGQQDDGTGEYDEDRPLMAFSPDTIVSDGDRIVYDGTEYELISKVDHDHYVEWTVHETNE